MCQALNETRNDRILFKENVEGINEYPHKWPDGEVSYRLNSYSSDFSSRNQLRAVTVALRAWQLRINKIKFRRERNPDASVDFDISFEPTDHFSSDNIFAHAYFPAQADISGDVHINDGWHWTSGVHLSDLARPPLVPVMIHEFGHSLGLRHDTLTSSQNTEIMYPSFNLGRKKTHLGPRDIERIQEKYGARNISQRMLDYFMNRRALGWDFS
jgi:hypothetical protein